jgi:hypothetical protein
MFGNSSMLIYGQAQDLYGPATEMPRGNWSALTTETDS